MTQEQLNILGACVVHDLGDSREDFEINSRYIKARVVIHRLARQFKLDSWEALQA